MDIIDLLEKCGLKVRAERSTYLFINDAGAYI